MEERTPLDLAALIGKLLKEKRFILIWCAASVVVGLIVAFSIPKEYKAGAKLAPEFTNRSSVASLTSLVGLSSSALASGASRDAVYPELYPDIMESIPFLVGMFDVPVTVEGEETDLYDYLLNHQKKAWWTKVLELPFKGLNWVIGLFVEEDEEEDDDAPVDTFRLTKKQLMVATRLKKRMDVSVDKKNYVVTLSVKMQDPLIAADVANKVLEELQDYITEYRTEKSRQTLEYTKGLYEASRDDYFAKQQAYAVYLDSHQNMVSKKARTEEERLQNEMNLAYQLYGRMAQQLQAAEAKVLEETPVFQVMQGPSVPIRKYRPSMSSIMVIFLLLGFCIPASWVLFGRDFCREVRG